VSSVERPGVGRSRVDIPPKLTYPMKGENIMQILRKAMQYVSRKASQIKDSAKTLALTVGTGIASMLGMGNDAHAALPPEATAAFVQISGNITDVLAGIWPLVALGVGGFTLIKLFKKGASRAV